MIDRLSYDPITGTSTNKRIYIKDGKRYDTPFSMTLYNYQDVLQMTAKLPLEMVQTYGSRDGSQLDGSSRRMIFVLRKKKLHT